MNSKSFLILAGTTAVAAALAVTSSLSWNSGSAVSDRGEIFLPSLAKNGADIGAITIETAEETMTLERDGDRFLDASGYPVKREAARELLASVSVLQIEENKTSDATRHADLELAPPEAKVGAGKKITFLAKDGKPLAGLIAGKSDSTVGGVSGGQYVRSLDNDQTYLARGSVKLPYSRAGWFENKLLEFEAKVVTSAGVTAGEGAKVSLTKVGDKLKLVDLPEGKLEDDEKINRLTRVFGNLSFSDVRTAKGDAPAAAPAVRLAIQDGVSFTVTSVAKDKENAHWIRIGAVETKDSAKDKAAKFAKKFDGFDFKISSYDGETFGWKIDDFTKTPGS